MRIILLPFAVAIILFASIASANDVPIEKKSAELGTKEQCQAFIKEEAKKMKDRGYKARAIMGLVFVCDNENYHIEMTCVESTAWLEIFNQDNSDWKRFYVD